MIVINPRLACRIDTAYDILQYPSGIIEIVGRCSLTGRDVIRYMDVHMNVFEFDTKTELWVSLEDCVCKVYVDNFSDQVPARYPNNMLTYKKDE